MEQNSMNEPLVLENLYEDVEIKTKEIVARYPKYLPLGSVVVLKNGWKKLMIIGHLPINMDKKDSVYDYLACLYPEGIVKTDYNILFNHEDIKMIYAIGLMDEEQKIYMSKLNELKTDEDKLDILRNLNEQ